MGLKGKTALVTGAAGFIGGRLVERLTLEEGENVHTLVRNFRSSSWLSRTNVDIYSGDLDDLAAIRKAISGCTIVFHCAATTSSDESEAYRTNVLGTQNLLEASQEAGVERFIYVSTAAVHKPLPKDQVVTEDMPLVSENDDVYARSKLAGERLAMQYHDQFGLPVVVLRPTIVFGPRAYFWTVAYAERLRKGTLSLAPGLDGQHNFVYVDDVVNALLLSADHATSPGEAYIIGATESVQWINYIQQYARLTGLDIPERSLIVTKALAQLFDRLDTGIATLRKNRHAWDPPLHFGLRGFRRLMRPCRGLELWEIQLYQKHFTFSIEKAQRMLGYRTQFTMESAIQETICWLKAQGYLPDADRDFVWK